jgi:hypothetical protein
MEELCHVDAWAVMNSEWLRRGLSESANEEFKFTVADFAEAERIGKTKRKI